MEKYCQQSFRFVMATLVSQHAHVVSLKVTHFIYCAFELMLLINLNVLFIVFFVLFYF